MGFTLELMLIFFVVWGVLHAVARWIEGSDVSDFE